MTEFYVPPDVPLYLTPDSIPVGRFCRTLRVPDDVQWVALVDGLLSTLSNPNMWRQYGTLTREETAEAWLAMLIESWDVSGCGSCELPGGGSVISQDGFGRFKMLDNGEWVEPTGDYALPPLTPRTEPTDEEKKCAAAANAANVYQQLYEQLADEYAANHDEALFFLAIGVAIGSLFLPPLGLLAASFLEIATILVAEGFLAFAFLTADVWTDEFTDQFKCILVKHATVEGDGSVTFDMNAVINDLTNEFALTFDVTLSAQRLALQVGTILKYTGQDGLNYAGSTTAITDAECETCFTFCVLHDFYEDMYAWDVPTDLGFGALGQYTPPFASRVGHRIAEGDYGTFCCLQRFFNLDGRFDRIEVDYNLSPGTFTAGSYTGIQLLIGATVVDSQLVSGSGTLSWDVTPFTDTFTINCLLSYSNSGAPSDGSGVITAVRFYGVGDPQLEFLLGVRCDEP